MPRSYIRLSHHHVSDHQVQQYYQARQVLDFELWRNGKTQASCPRAGSKLTAHVIQLRPQFFDLGSYLSGTPPVEKDNGPHARIVGEYSIEAHYPDWID